MRSFPLAGNGNGGPARLDEGLRIPYRALAMLDMFATNFSVLDWIIVGIYLVATAALGIAVNRYVHNVSDYMVGGRAAGASLNIATYIGTSLGLVTIMYASIEGFHKGLAYLALPLIWVVVVGVLGKTGWIISKLRALKLTTIPEYFEKRFDKRTRVTAGVICALAGILNMGLFPKMGATFVTYATGLGATGADSTLTVNLVMSVLIVLVLLYTVMGGMISVIVTDYVQFIVLSLGLGLGLYFCLSSPDIGWSRMMGTLVEHRGESAFNPFHPDSYGWLYLVWQVLLCTTAAIAWAPEATRALTTKDVEATKRTFFFAMPGMFIRLALPALLAIAAFTLFAHNADYSRYFFPEGLGAKAAHAGQAMPLLIGKIVPAGLLGILVAGLTAAFMSTHDSYFLCWASVIVRDVIGVVKKEPLSDQRQIRITRIVIVCIGVFLLIWGIWYELPESVWNYMAITGTVYLSGAGIALIGGMYWSRASRTGAFAALLAGLISVCALFIEPLQSVVPWISAELVGLANYIVCAVVFVVFSLLFPDVPQVEGKES